MQHKTSRRSWIRNSALLTGGITLLPGLFNKAGAEKNDRNKYLRFFDDREFRFDEEDVMPELKARLFANENPFGPSEAARKALSNAVDTACRYPMDALDALQKKIADTEGVKVEQVLMGAGSSPLLRVCSIYYGKPGSNIVTANPTYDDLPSHCSGFNAEIIQVPLTAQFEFDLDAIEQKINDKTSLVYICNPNNPTGTVLDPGKLKAFCQRVSKKTTVFIDEAYIDYLDDPQSASMINCIKNGDNVIVARTFSKLYGFAGLRVGYILAQPDIIEKLGMYTAGAWSISATSVAAANVAYKEQPYLGDALKKTLASKEYLYKVLKEEGYDYIPSQTNFVMFPIRIDGQKFIEEMRKRGVGVRFWQFNDRNWCRVSIGRMDEMEAFAKAFKEIS